MNELPDDHDYRHRWQGGMPNYTGVSMSTPEDKLIAAASAAKTDISKVKALWTDYRLYIACTLCLILGVIIGLKL